MDGDVPAPREEIAGLADPRAPWEEHFEDPAAPRAMLAVLFTDIIGSTELATALGDKRWRELLEQHDAAIRTQIARFDGREVDTAGDAFFATFGLAVRAVDCALESARAVRRLGLRIRAGVHMGECVVSDVKVRGVTVHIGARVGAKARGDEVLVSSTVRDILAGAGLRFVERGEHTLKGVEGRWRLYAVEPRARDNEADLPPLLEAEIAAPPKPAWRRPNVLVAAATALAVLVGAIAFVTLRGGGLSSVPADSVAVIDADSGDVASTVAVRRRPVGLAAAPDGIWVANSIDRSVTHIGKDGRRDETIPVGPGPIGVVSGAGLIWVANADGRSVSRVSPETGGEVGERIQAGNGLSALAYGADALWLANAVDGTVWRVDPPSGKRLKEIPVGPGLRGLAIPAKQDAVWVTSETAGTVTQIDPASGGIVRVVHVGNGPGAVAVGAGAVWVANAYDSTVSRVDPGNGTVTKLIRVGKGPRAIALARGHVFVANEESGTVSMIDAQTGNVVREIDLVNAPMGLAAAGNRVWVSVRGGILRYKGGTLRIGTSEVLGTFDPSFGDGSLPYLMTNVYDGLTAFKRVGGPEGNQLLPNLAEEIRPPTDDGLTYAYTLRAGLKYSDGSPVRASDVRSTFERLIRAGQFGGSFLGSLKGTEACTPKNCDLSSSVVANDDARTIVFHLRRANSDFPYILALPNLGIVPSSAPPTDGGTTPIPGTGPYRIVSGELEREGESAIRGTVVLGRNPHFRSRGLAQPDGYPDRIEVTMGGDPEDYIVGVKDGRFDYTPDLAIPGLPSVELAAEFPSQIHVLDLPATVYAVLNSNVPPFNDVRARKAFNYAIDRRALVREGGGPLRLEVSCQLLPENMIGYAPHCPYTLAPNASGVWNAPDIAAGRRLVAESGTGGQRVTIWIQSGDSPFAQVRRRLAPVMASALEQIGYRADVREVPGDDSGYFAAVKDPKSKNQVMLTGWASDYPAPANFFLSLTTCPETLAQLGQNGYLAFGYCSPDLDKLVLQALDLQREDLAAAAKLWTRVDQAVTDAAPLVFWSNLRSIFFVSRHVGNVQGHTAYVVLLSQMWVVKQPQPSPS